MSDQYVGEIRIFAGPRPPSGWVLCDGRTLTISQNQALFSLLGTSYGGDGVSNFKLPDLRGRAVVHQGTGASGTAYPLGSLGGQEQVALVPAQLPVHTHPVLADPAPGEVTSASPAGAFWGSGPNNAYSNVAATAQMDPACVSSAGSAAPHENMMPFVVVNYIIALSGIYPSRS